jgi:hypothetical protein
VARVLVISLSDLACDARVHRQVGFLRARHEVTTAALGPSGHDGVAHIDLSSPQAGRLEAATNQALGAVRMAGRRYERAYWGNRQLAHAASTLSGVEAELVVANDLITLPIALRAAAGAPVVLDAHEFTPREYEELRWWRLLMAPYMRHLALDLVPRVAGMMTVAPGIAEAWEDLTGVRPVVVTNAPARVDLEPTPVGDPVRMIHFGVADPARRIDRMIEVVAQLDSRFTLDLVLLDHGGGEIRRLREVAAGDPRIRFLPAMPMERLIPAANDYDIGLYLLEPRSFNARHALPNKLFDFLQARLAVAIGPSPEMAAVVSRWDAGIVADDFSPAALARALSELDADAIAALKRGAAAAAAELCAEHNAPLVLEVVERALTERDGSRAATVAANG